MRRQVRSRRGGFTLIEMMVALAAGTLVVSAIYVIGSSSSRQFQEQQRVGSLQLAVRLAAERVRRDFQRAGLHGTPNSATDRVCGTRPSQPVQGVAITDRSSTTADALGAMTGWSEDVSHGDRVRITGNFRTGDTFLVREWNGTGMSLQTQWQGFRRAFARDPNAATYAVDEELFRSVFSDGTTLMVRAGGGQRMWTTVSSTAVSGGEARISTSPGFPASCSNAMGIEGWCQNGCTVAPITVVEYEIVPAPPALAARAREVTGANTVLLRTERNADTNAVIGTPTVILEWAVHFDVDVIEDTAAIGAPQALALQDDAAAELATTARPAAVRGLRFSLAARSPDVNPHLPEGVTGLADGTPRVFSVFGERGLGSGAARVRHAYGEVFLPNMALPD